MPEAGERVLLIGYGNPGRLDDGLGPALAAAVEKLEIAGVTVEAAYQLNVEDAAAAAEHDVVIFTDADVTGPEPFFFRRIAPEAVPSFSTHSVEPQTVLGLAWQMFGACTEGYILGIRGYCFNDFGESLSERARANLDAAVGFLEPLLRGREFQKAAECFEELCVSGAELCSEDETCRPGNM